MNSAASPPLSGWWVRIIARRRRRRSSSVSLCAGIPVTLSRYVRGGLYVGHMHVDLATSDVAGQRAPHLYLQRLHGEAEREHNRNKDAAVLDPDADHPASW